MNRNVAVVLFLHYLGAPPPPMFTEPPPIEDTPRTYRSDVSTARLQAQQKTEPEKILLTAQDTMEALNKSFSFFKKAIVSSAISFWSTDTLSEEANMPFSFCLPFHESLLS